MIIRRPFASLLIACLAGHALAAPPRAGDMRTPAFEAGCALDDGTVIPPREQRGPNSPHLIPAPVVTLDTDGTEMPFDTRANPANRLQLIVMGDGYTSGQQGLFQSHATSTVNAFFNIEPFKRYKNLFNVVRVEVVSGVSGVSGDPTSNVTRNTPLQMNYWCGGTERLLCVNTTTAISFANNAPYGWDQILTLANSTKYGGAGYPGQNVGTVAGGNSLAADIAIHEMGHSLGDLADEYDYGGPTTYTGGELIEANSSIYPAATQTAQSMKWFRWIGVNDPAWDGVHNSFEGSSYSVLGVYRPTANSMMRSLQRPFNLVSAEKLIIELYRIVRPIDSATPPGTLNAADSVFVDVVQPTQPLSIEWRVDGQLVATNVPTLDLSSLDLRGGASVLKVRVRDNTTWVRNENARNALMTQEMTWTLNIPACPADLNNDRVVDDADFVRFASAYELFVCGVGTPCIADFNADGFVDDTDFVHFAAAYEAFTCD